MACRRVPPPPPFQPLAVLIVAFLASDYAAQAEIANEMYRRMKDAESVIDAAVVRARKLRHLRLGDDEMRDEIIPAVKRAIPQLKEAKSFMEIYTIVSKAVGRPSAHLLVYDIAQPLGEFYHLPPTQKQPVQAGALRGAYRLHLTDTLYGRVILSMPKVYAKCPELAALHPDQLEDFLCVVIARDWSRKRKGEPEPSPKKRAREESDGNPRPLKKAKCA
jgi:hypothetical protein